MEVFEEEGEIMLHNKRNNGKLFGLIKPKKGVYPFNMSEYLGAICDPFPTIPIYYPYQYR